MRLQRFLDNQPETTLIDALETPLDATLRLAGADYAFKASATVWTDGTACSMCWTTRPAASNCQMATYGQTYAFSVRPGAAL